MFNEKLSMSIKTYNRAALVDEYVGYIIETMEALHIDLYVLDGSTDDSTRYVMEKYMKGYDNVRYFKYDDIDGGFKRYWDCWGLPDTEYVWLSGDNYRTSIQALERLSAILAEDEDIDILTFYHCFVEQKESRYFDRSESFLRDLAVPLTHWGSTIIKKELMSKSVFIEYWNKFDGPQRSFPHIFMYANAICKPNFKGFFQYFEEGMQVQLRKNAQSGLIKNHTVWRAFLRNWNLTIDALPSEYDAVKADLYKSIDQYTTFFSYPELRKMRFYNEYNLWTVLEQRKYIKRSLSTPYRTILRLALTPKSFIYWEKVKEGESVYNLEQYLRSRHKRKRVIIYGAGMRGNQAYEILREAEQKGNINIVGIADKNYKNIKNDKFKVESIDALIQKPYDKVLVAIIDRQIYFEIQKELIEKGIKKRKIIQI